MPEPYDWAVKFENEAKGLLVSGDDKPLVHYETLGREALLAIPTPDHYLPLLYVVGTRQHADTVTFPVDGVDGGSISMLCVQVG
jgi:4,5-DOPA dioxygenase extradiol